MEGTSLFIWGFVFGILGLGYFIYGKRQKSIVPLITGIALFVFPYFVANLYILLVIGAIFLALPYFLRG